MSEPQRIDQIGSVYIVNTDWRSNHKDPVGPLTDDLPHWFKQSKTEYASFSYASDGRYGRKMLYWTGGTFFGNWGQFGCGDSQWLHGTFKGNVFSGEWYNGTFEGNYFGGTWYNGTFKKGNFNGTWYSGLFLGGRFFNSCWYAGTFSDGIFECSRWYTGNFEGGTFLSSEFYRGSFFVKGKFEKSELYGGHFSGTFVSGEIKTPTLLQFAGKWEDKTKDKILTLAALMGIHFDKKGYAIGYRKTRMEGKGCYNPKFVQKKGPFTIKDAAKKGSGTCCKGLHVCGPYEASYYFDHQNGDILWQVKFHKDDLMDCDGQKARIRKGTATPVPWTFLTKEHIILKEYPISIGKKRAKKS